MYPQIVQEIHTARAVSVQCGSHDVDWYVFVKAGRRLAEVAAHQPALRRTLFQTEPKGEIIRRSFQFLEAVALDRKGKARSDTGEDHTHDESGLQKTPGQIKGDAPSKQLYELLRHATHLHATDPRDRGFALLGVTAVRVIYGSNASLESDETITVN